MTAALANLALLIWVAAITPGPNNLIILEISMTKGWKAALLPIISILIGTQLVLLAAAFGLDWILRELPALHTFLLLSGCLYLCFAGFKLITAPTNSSATVTTSPSAVMLLLLQIINPKTWILVGTAFTASTAHTAASFNLNPLPALSLMILLISCLCLFLWVTVGNFLKSRLNQTLASRYVMPTLGSALILSSVTAFIPSLTDF